MIASTFRPHEERAAKLQLSDQETRLASSGFLQIAPSLGETISVAEAF
jgi:hypothetical protein